MSRVEVDHLTKRFGKLLVLDDISFQVDDGDFLCIVGPTGCGKTTFLNSLVKLYDIDSGEIRINGEGVDLKKHSIAYIMQEYSTMSWLTVRENIRFGMKVRKFPGKDGKKDRGNVENGRHGEVRGLLSGPAFGQYASEGIDCPGICSGA